MKINDGDKYNKDGNIDNDLGNDDIMAWWWRWITGLWSLRRRKRYWLMSMDMNVKKNSDDDDVDVDNDSDDDGEGEGEGGRWW